MEEALLGREVELRTVDAFLDRASEGFAALVLEGEPGIGKTALWREAVRRAKSRGFVVLFCRPAEAEAKLSYSALADLLEPVGAETFASLPEPQRRALEVALLRMDPGGDAIDGRAVAAGVRALLVSLARRAPVLVAIDDTQWLDTASARALEFVLRRIEGERIGALGARRPAAGGRRDRLGLGEAQLLEMDGLSLAAIHELLKRRLAHSLPRPLLVRLQETCRGNPFFALEITREVLRSAVGPADPLPVPKDLRRLIGRRIGRLSAPARETLLVAAALARPTVALLSEALGRDPSSALEEAERAEVAEVAGERVRFVHPLFAATVNAMTPATERRLLHRRLARVARDPEEQAMHLALSVAAPDPAVATTLEEAANRARARGAWEAAADLVERALLLTPPNRVDDVWRRSFAAADYLRDVGDFTEARAVLAHILDGDPPREIRARAQHLLALAAWFAGDCDDAITLLELASEEADDEFLRAKIERDAGMLLAANWEVRRAEPHIRVARELGEQLDDPILLARTLPAVVMSEFVAGRGADFHLLERARALESFITGERTALRATYWSGYILSHVGELDAARLLFEDLLRHTAEVGDASYRPEFLAHLADLELRAGNLERADALATEAVQDADQIESEILDEALATRSAIEAHGGDLGAARHTLGEARSAVTIELPIDAAKLGAVGAFIALSSGDPAATLAAVDGLYDRLRNAGVGEPTLFAFLPDQIEALIAVGRLGEARRLLEWLDQRSHALDRPWGLATSARCHALLHAAEGDLPAALMSTDAALNAHQRLPMPFELARTLLASGMIERRTKQKSAAKASLEQALSIFDQLGARLWAQRTRAELQRVGLGRRSLDELTGSEQRVAELAASGLKNREVAAQLFMSPKTVEANLSRVYDKLGVRSRAELGARLAKTLRGPP